MWVYHDLFFAARIRINVSWSGSGSGQMILIQPDPKQFNDMVYLHFPTMDDSGLKLWFIYIKFQIKCRVSGRSDMALSTD